MARNWAICVGINRYGFHRPLNCAVNDATEMNNFFEEVNFDKVYLFTDTSEPIPDMKNNFPSQPISGMFYSWLGYKFKPDKPLLNLSDNLWFFFSGHGRQYRGQDYLLFSDSSNDPEGFERTAIPISEITNYLRRSGAGNIIMLLDACRDSPSKSSSFDLSKEQGIIKISSCQHNQLSYEIPELNHGAFTYALLESLRLQGEGNCATLERLCQRLRNRVKEVTWKHQQKIQIPYAAVEPETKYHLLLLPDYIIPNDADLSQLREDAKDAELEGNLILAETIWTRLVKFDSEKSLKALKRIWSKNQQNNQALTQPVPLSKEVSPSLETKSVNSPEQPQTIPEVTEEKKEEPELKTDTFEVVTVEADKSEQSQQKSHLFQFTVATIERETTENQNLFSRVFKGKESQEQWVINQQQKQASGIREALSEGLILELMEIPGGTFWMGTDDAEIERLCKKFNWDYFRREKPQHQVILQPFAMGRYPITQAQWKAIAERTDLRINIDLDPDPSKFKDDPLQPPLDEGEKPKTRWDRPVERVNWYQAQEFCDRLSKLTGQRYRLPTEAEWEYACRANTTTAFHFGETITGDLANYRASSTYADEPPGEYRNQTTPVGYFKVANAFGLYDMHGNVWEWCQDDFHSNYEGAPTDGSAWIEAQNSNTNNPSNSAKNNNNKPNKVIRGGSWCDIPLHCRSALRINYNPRDHNYNVGFRVVRSFP
ncbi:MAG: SUMF1/EgtB/PvdO family nonheme iron enzyme [Crocosphaera sp.]